MSCNSAIYIASQAVVVGTYAQGLFGSVVP